MNQISRNKWLVQLLNGVNGRMLFFGFWLVITGLLAWLFIRYQRKMERRNFREGSSKPIPKKGQSTSLVVKNQGTSISEKQRGGGRP